jgi:hypothetical protein
MKKMWTVAALALLLGVGVATTQGRADEPPRVIPANQNIVIAAPASDCGCNQGAAPRKTLFQKMKGAFGSEPNHNQTAGTLGCMPNSDISCGTWHQEYKFLFGSCRDFFGCPCFKTPEQLMSISEGEYLGRTNPGINRVNKTYP